MGNAYPSGTVFSSNTSAYVSAGGTIAALGVAAGMTVKFICSNALTITALTLGKGAKVTFTGGNLATITNTVLDTTTGSAIFSVGSGGLTFTNQPPSMSTLTVLEFLSAGTTITCNNGAAWNCELRMTANGIFSSSSCTSLAGIISGVGALTLPTGCATITSTGVQAVTNNGKTTVSSNRGTTPNSIVFGCPASFSNANIFSSGILTLLYSLTYSGPGLAPIAAANAIFNQVAANAPPCSAFVLGSSVTINGGAGLILNQITDSPSATPTFAGTLTIGTYSPAGNNMVVSSGPLSIKKMTMPTGTFSTHNLSGAIINMGG